MRKDFDSDNTNNLLDIKMKIKEKVLKEVLQMKWNGKSKEDKLGFGLSKTIDLTLAEVKKVIDDKINYWIDFIKKQGHKKGSVKYVRVMIIVEDLKELKQKLGIKPSKNSP